MFEYQIPARSMATLLMPSGARLLAGARAATTLAKFFVEEGVSAKTDRLDKRQLASGSAGWRALYAAAEAIGVNISALVKQLEEEGVLHVERTGHGSTLYPQAKLGDMLATTVSL